MCEYLIFHIPEHAGRKQNPIDVGAYLIPEGFDVVESGNRTVEKTMIDSDDDRGTCTKKTIECGVLIQFGLPPIKKIRLEYLYG